MNPSGEYSVDKIRQWRAQVSNKRKEIFGSALGLGSGKLVRNAKEGMTQKDLRDYLFAQFEAWKGRAKVDDESDEYQSEEA